MLTTYLLATVLSSILAICSVPYWSEYIEATYKDVNAGAGPPNAYNSTLFFCRFSFT